jgi:hypothetical protein
MDKGLSVELEGDGVSELVYPPILHLGRDRFDQGNRLLKLDPRQQFPQPLRLVPLRKAGSGKCPAE